QRLGPCDGCVDVVYLEPEQQTVPRRHVVRIADASVMMLHFPAVQLHHQLAGMDETFVVRPAMCAFAIEQALIPPAARLDILHANQRLRSHYPASPYRTPSHTVGSSGVVQSTRCFLNAGMLMKSPGFISTTPSSNCNLAAPFRTISHSCCVWSYQTPSGEACP